MCKYSNGRCRLSIFDADFGEMAFWFCNRPPAPIAEFEIAAFCNFRHSAGLSPAQFDPMSPFVPILALRINERRGDTQTCKYSDIQTCKDANTQTR